MHKYKDLKVWQKTMDLVEAVCNLTNRFPNEEKYGLISKIRRSVVSIPSNISEESGWNSKKECNQFLAISVG